MADIVVHHLETSRSHRILWLLEELEAPYEMKRYARTSAFRAPPELRAIHPLGKSPVVTVDSAVLAESGAIVEHLVEEVGGGRLRPEPGTDAHRRYRFFLHYAEGSMMSPLLVRLITSRIRNAPVPFFVRPVTRKIAGQIDEGYTVPELERHLDFLESELAAQPYLAGDDLTAADVMMSYPLEAAGSRHGFGDRSRLESYVERTRARAAYQRAIEKGGPVVP